MSFLRTIGAHIDDLVGLNRPLDHLLDLLIEIVLMFADHVRFGLGHRVFCHKDGAAVLVGKNGGLVGSDLFGHLNDLLLVKTDQRPEDRQGADLIGDRESSQGLGRDLPDTLSGDESEAFVFLCQALGDPHHIAAHDASYSGA